MILANEHQTSIALRIMNEYDDLDIYNGDAVHNMEVDFDFHIKTGELPEYFKDTDLDTFIDNLNDWD